MAKTTYIVFRATNEEFDRIISHLGRFIYNFPNYYPKTGLRFRDFCKRCEVLSSLSIEEHRGSRLFLYESKDKALTRSTMDVLIDHGVLTVTAPDLCTLCEYCVKMKGHGAAAVEDRKLDMEHLMIDVKPAHIVAKLNQREKERTKVKEEPTESRTLSEEQVEALPAAPLNVVENEQDENRPIEGAPACPVKKRTMRSIEGIEGDNIVSSKRHRQYTAKMLASLEMEKQKNAH